MKVWLQKALSLTTAAAIIASTAAAANLASSDDISDSQLYTSVTTPLETETTLQETNDSPAVTPESGALATEETDTQEPASSELEAREITAADESGADEPATDESGADVLTDDDTGTDDGAVYPNAEPVLRYFPVTLYDYDQSVINNATHQLEVDAALAIEAGISGLTGWNGIYFGGGLDSDIFTYTDKSQATPVYEKVALSFDANGYLDASVLEAGATYILVNVRSNLALVGNSESSSITGIAAAAAGDNKCTANGAAVWTITAADTDGYYYVQSADGNYLGIQAGVTNSQSGESFNSTQTSVLLRQSSLSAYSDALIIGNGNGGYLNQWGGGSSTIFGVYSDDAGCAFYLYKATEEVGYGTGTTGSLTYAGHNNWTGKGGNNGNRTYSGLVENQLDSNKMIQFAYMEPGLFTLDTSNKSVYTNVGFPLYYHPDTGYYTFSTFDKTDEGTGITLTARGAYFSGGEGKSNTNLVDGDAQSVPAVGADGMTTGFFPFNDGDSATNPNFYFGMRAVFPIIITENGRMEADNDNSDPLLFEFSGDDDVWVFLDGTLVLDMGGIRNAMTGRLNFADNTWIIDKVDQRTDAAAAADVNGAALSGKIFNDDEGEGLLNQTRASFSANKYHELTIYYLERGAGSSNLELHFNVPTDNQLEITKQVSEQCSAGETLSDDLMTTINNTEFGMKLYRYEVNPDYAQDNTQPQYLYIPAAGMDYTVLDARGSAVGTGTTTDDGHFVLKNNHTARFSDDIVFDGETGYLVVEDYDDIWVNNVRQWENPQWSVSTNTNSEIHTEEADLSSTAYPEDAPSSIAFLEMTSIGNATLRFVCQNTLTHQEIPSVTAVRDNIVIDFGLPVEIDVLQNDLVIASDQATVQIISVGPATDITGESECRFGEARISEDGTKLIYTPTKAMDNIEILSYTVKVYDPAGTEVQEVTSSGVLNIIPATSMYYEENFGTEEKPFVTYTGAWERVGTPQTDTQEPGIIGNDHDSPYGSDAAYLYNTGDSYGTSMYVNTTNGAASFSYEFYGTGTTFYGRMSDTSAYMIVTVTNLDTEEIVENVRRNTIYRPTDGTGFGPWYNIPLFSFTTEQGDPTNYGHYRVDVTVVKALKRSDGTWSRGPEFWLDGIRVYSPISSENNNYSGAQNAYAQDREAHCAVVTLRDKLIADDTVETENGIDWKDGSGFVLFTDSNGEMISAADYISFGPKEEVYLNNGQSVTFTLDNWDASKRYVYLGIKAPVGSGSVSINGTTLSIVNTTDCYYDIASYADITYREELDGEGNSVTVQMATFQIEATSSLISVTNIKVTGHTEFAIIGSESDITVDGDTGDDGEITVDGGDVSVEATDITVDTGAVSADGGEDTEATQSGSPEPELPDGESEQAQQAPASSDEEVAESAAVEGGSV
ncbi:MAG: hypothetical protein ACI3W5_09300 [Faecousia sp.]